ncbi:CocE/NonD family hydrolase [Streptomyces lavendulocolor]|uniref:CocE/NonD family hydrolase n=1 Tax=Streptomyces lavendulocolor TaxID=67316 RepID=A0ABV2WF81_9ACTN
MKIRTAFPYETVHEDVRIPLPDGTRLYARVWRPLTDGPGAPVPALLEYDPCRLTDWTAPRDRQRHPWYAGHGYASVRVDARGHGNSGGLPGDEHSGRDAADAAEVVAWLAARPWCDGRVGMFGIGRGGATALGVAALAPEPLRAVVAVCCPDGRYGGGDPGPDRPDWPSGPDGPDGPCSAAGPPARAAALLALAARPPDPLYVGDAWREMWLARMEALVPPVHARLARSSGDAAGPPGAPGSGRAAVLAVGGWHDPYRDTVLRLVEQLPGDRVRGIIGPWTHQYPDRERPPGPAIGFLQETLRWWDHHLRDEPTGVMAEPLLRSWIGGPALRTGAHPPPAAPAEPGAPIEPAGTVPEPPTPATGEPPTPATAEPPTPGRWVGDPAWPSPHVTPVTYALQGAPVLVRSPQHTGLDAGPLVPPGEPTGGPTGDPAPGTGDGTRDDPDDPYGGTADLPPDQRAEDAHAACFDFPVPPDGAPVEILGRPLVSLTLRGGAPGGQVVARLCDIAPDGSSTLVTRGALRLPAGPEGRREHVVELHGAGHAFPPGHRVRLAVSSAYWPWIWPGPRDTGFTLDPAACSLRLPVRRPAPGTVELGEPEQAEPLGVTVPAALDDSETRRPARLVVRDVARGEWRLEESPRQDGARAYPDGLEIDEDTLDTAVITERDPLSARTRSRWRIRLHRPDLPWSVTVDARSEISCDATHFLVTDEVICAEGTEVLFHHTWEKRVARAPG